MNSLTTTFEQRSAERGSDHHRWLRPGIIGMAGVLILFCAVIRFYDLGSKFVWGDEETTFIHISSNSDTEIRAQYAGRPMCARDWRGIEAVAKTAPLKQVAHNLKAKDYPDQAPIFYLLCRVWAQAFGFTPLAVRCLCVIFSLISLPLIFLLAKEMFDGSEVAWLSVALVAVSPYFMLYAQEARPYSLWLCLSLLSWIALGRASRTGSIKSWIIFGISAALTALTHYASIMVQSAVLIPALSTRRRATFIGVLIAAATAVLLFLPWLLYTGPAMFQSVSEGLFQTSLGAGYLPSVIRNVTRVFIDTGSGLPWVVAILIESTALIFAYRRATPQGRLVLQSAALYILIFSLPDLLFGGRRLAFARYLTPSLVMMPICFAACITAILRRQIHTGIALLCTLIAAGVMSCTAIATSPLWWNKVSLGHNQRSVAALLNRERRTIWIGVDVNEVLLMSRLVNEDVLLELAPHEQAKVPDGVDHIYLCENEKGPALAYLRQCGWSATANSTGKDLWQLTRNSERDRPGQ